MPLNPVGQTEKFGRQDPQPAAALPEDTPCSADLAIDVAIAPRSPADPCKNDAPVEDPPNCPEAARRLALMFLSSAVAYGLRAASKSIAADAKSRWIAATAGVTAPGAGDDAGAPLLMDEINDRSV